MKKKSIFGRYVPRPFLWQTICYQNTENSKIYPPNKIARKYYQVTDKFLGSLDIYVSDFKSYG